MTSTRRAFTVLRLALSALVVGCGAQPTPPVEGPPARPPEIATPAAPGPGSKPATAPKVRVLAADETLTTASGATFTAPGAWTLEQHADEHLVLKAPEGDLALTHVELAAPDRDTAVRSAWARVSPGFGLPVSNAIDAPDKEGWDTLSQVTYVTPAEEQRVVAAIVRRKGDLWYVILADGKGAAFERRGAQLASIVTSLRVAGREVESFAGRTPHPLDADRLAKLDAFVEEARGLAGIPGVAIAIVSADRIVHARGFGVRALGQKAKVTPDTRFMIGSIGKSLTTLMMARLVEAGRFSWDTPVREVLPAFALGEAEITKTVTMKHTACACTGMPRQDLEMIFEAAATPEERLATMSTMVPTTKLGETFQYSNLMVMAGGYAAGHAYAPKKPIGAAYDAAMQELVFRPLGMKRTTLDFATVARSDHASPHVADVAGVVTPLPLAEERWVLAVRPAGGHWSTVRDMAQVIRLELAKGTLGGKRIIGEDVLLARRQPQIKVDDDTAYGLGLGVSHSVGLPTLTHSGGTAGFSTNLVIFPEQQLGLIVLTNQADAGALLGATTRRLLELVYDGEEKALPRLRTMLQQQASARAETAAEVQVPPDAAWFDALVGRYQAAGMGTIELRRDRGTPVLDAGEWRAPVGRRTHKNGKVTLIITAGAASAIELRPDSGALVLDDGQTVHRFERASK